MATKMQTVREHFNISDKEWKRMTRNQKMTKVANYNQGRTEARQEAYAEKMENRLSDQRSKKRYGQGSDSRLLKDNQIRDTLNKAGYNIKQDTSAAQRFKERYGKK